MKLAAALAALALLAPPSARAAGDLIQLEVLVDGRPLDELVARGSTYVEALRGRPYSLRVTNRQGARVAVAVSVDGLNVIDAKRTSAARGRKWILEPWESLVLDGWQTSDREAHRFVFTSEPRSYAAWQGDASQAGVLEVAAFRERPRVAKVERPWWGHDRDGASRDSRERQSPSAPEPLAGGAAPSVRSESASKSRDQSLSEDSAATGFGDSVGHEVVQVRFEHEDAPCATARIRYEYRDALVRLGVLPQPWLDPLDRRERARGFTDSYCPAPPRGW